MSHTNHKYQVVYRGHSPFVGVTVKVIGSNLQKAYDFIDALDKEEFPERYIQKNGKPFEELRR